MKDLSSWKEKFEVCVYAKKLLDKLEYLNTKVKNPVDIEEVKKGIYYARKYHGSQMRQSGDPYYSHPIEVAYLLAHYAALKLSNFFRTDLLIAALLHDTLEDTSLKKEEIEVIFNKNVAHYVESLTRVKIDTKISAAETVILLHKQKNDGVLLIKLCDRLHNMQTINAKNPEKIKKIKEETINYFILLAGYLGIPQIEYELLELCSITQKRFKNSERRGAIKDNYQPLFQAFQNDLYSI
ncbi:Guanosine polyphosphate pyrophosphohydrolases/synthetases homolog [Rickettsia felis URRWXCal2]|uniref:GTP diphosphokinase n=1 Tax=Rickettsia felis (strain ATCC VR-1525 / URRWXCal2) TaxID=315456 RepID=Q4UJL0_RICFE|nr:HD domain-containing protein [Rickettsia felis]AAY61291.1 Guanosine polyphosphate pyrophosphohydrolases/synthetases homolog [Rickettsia felis URRWXCal2]